MCCIRTSDPMLLNPLRAVVPLATSFKGQQSFKPKPKCAVYCEIIWYNGLFKQKGVGYMHTHTHVHQLHNHAPSKEHNYSIPHPHHSVHTAHIFLEITQPPASCLPPPHKVKPHVIVQHRCTSFSLSHQPPLWETVDSWLTESTVSGKRHPAELWSPLWPAGHLLLHRNPPPAAIVNTHWHLG